jgi:hypothetical protein
MSNIPLTGTQEYGLAEIRKERNRLLAESDWTQFADSPLDQETKNSWATYRQALRDMPESVELVFNPKGYLVWSAIQFPQKPE